MRYRLHAAISCSIPSKEGYLGTVDLGIKLCEIEQTRSSNSCTRLGARCACKLASSINIRSINIVFTIVAIITWLKFCCALLAWYLAPLDILIGPRREIPSGGSRGGILSRPRRTHTHTMRESAGHTDAGYYTTYTNEALHQ
jgi:hypothetical protein